MSEVFRKIGLFGLGVMAITQEKIEEFSQEMVKKGEMNREEGKKFVMEVLSEKDRQLKELGDKINQKVKEAVESTGAATTKDIQEIKKRIDSIENRLDAIEKWKQG
jgi:polyhydroxyalkanoate synthesis regulator phasin